MKKRTLSFFLFLVGLVFISSNAFAAWTQAKGHSYNQLTFSHYKTVEKYTSLGYDRGNLGGSIDRHNLNTSTHRLPSEEFTSTKISYYGEFGLTDKLTLIASGAWDWQKTNDAQRYGDTDGPSGIGDIILGARHKVADNIGAGILSSVQVDVKIPEAYDYNEPIGTQSLGDGQYDVTGKLVFGKGFSWGYSVFSAGYKYRFENDQIGLNFKPSDQMLLSLSGGYSAFPWLSIRGSLDYNKPVGNAKVSQEMITFNKVNGSGQDYQQDNVLVKDTLGLEAEALSGGVALAFSVASGTQVVLSYNTELYGRDASIGQTYSIALAKSL